jgi:hypothetical protein
MFVKNCLVANSVELTTHNHPLTHPHRGSFLLCSCTDLMEPVTYFTFNFFWVIAYFWWWTTNTSFSYPAMRDSALNRFTKSLYSRAAKDDFDIAKYEALVKEVSDLEHRIEVANKQLAVSDAIHDGERGF